MFQEQSQDKEIEGFIENASNFLQDNGLNNLLYQQQ